ncbi:hypothetical protein PV325_006596 [Microctonus aethiopoides]|nr:hypothetical protein PV325_006596 [Microctonus aethiopoides]
MIKKYMINIGNREIYCIQIDLEIKVRPFTLSGKPKPTSFSSSVSSSASTSHHHHHHMVINRPKRVMTLTPSEDSQTLENQEILNFGIPVVDKINNARPDSKKKTTRPQPFPLVELSHVRLAPFSFEGRDKMVAKKKEELRIKIQEEERKTRVFHANPAPTFRPVAVRSVSRENIKIESKTKSAVNLRTDGKINYGGKNDKYLGMICGKFTENLKITAKIDTRNTSIDNLKTIRRINSCNNIRNKSNDIKPRKSSVGQINNQENITPHIPASKEINPTIMPTLKPKLKPLPIELHSDKRAKMRREYDEKVKLKLKQEEQRCKKEQENRLANEQAEIHLFYFFSFCLTSNMKILLLGSPIYTSTVNYNMLSDLSLNDTVIPYVTYARNLGVVLQTNSPWSKHMSYVSSRVQAP